MLLANEIDSNLNATSRQFQENGPTSSWFRRFKARHNLSVQTPENKSVARYDAEDAEILTDFFLKSYHSI